MEMCILEHMQRVGKACSNGCKTYWNNQDLTENPCVLSSNALATWLSLPQVNDMDHTKLGGILRSKCFPSFAKILVKAQGCLQKWNYVRVIGLI